MTANHESRQIDLFGNLVDASVQIPIYKEIKGLQYIPEFLSREVHDRLLTEIDKQTWLTNLRRRVQHYGYRYDYKSRTVDYSMRIGELPGWAMEVARRLVGCDLFRELPDQVIVNEYEPGQGIRDHIDCEPCFTDTIASLSLGSPCVMNFRQKSAKMVIPVLLEPRSIVVLTGPSRYDWRHGIPPRKSDQFGGRSFKRSRRVSLTFRKIILKED